MLTSGARSRRHAHDKGGTATGVEDLVALQEWIGAARSDKIGFAEALLQRRPRLLNTRAQAIGNTALHWAAAKGHLRMLVWLLEVGADESVVNNSGAPSVTPL